MRDRPSLLHVDLDAFFAAVEQRDKPSLRGRPVIVGGTGGRGVVSTCSYEARRFGVRSAMSTAEARARCPHAAFLSGRFDAYREASQQVMAELRRRSPLVEPMSLDEAFVDLDAAPEPHPGWDTDSITAVAADIKAAIAEATDGLTASVGAGTSKLIAKIASDLDKPDGTVVVPPGTEVEFLAPLSVSVIPGIGPRTSQRLALSGVKTVGDLQLLSEHELVRQLGDAHGRSLFGLCRGADERAVVPDRETKSVSVEDTFATDIADRATLRMLTDRMSRRVSERLSAAGLSGRTVTLKVKRPDFVTRTKSATLAGPTDDRRVITSLAMRLLEQTDVTGGLRLLGVGVSGLADWIQDDLMSAVDEPVDEPVDVPAAAPLSDDEAAALGADASVPAAYPDGAVKPMVVDGPDTERAETDAAADSSGPRDPAVTAGSATSTFLATAGARPGAGDPDDGTPVWRPGQDVRHEDYGDGWVWGAGRGRVTVRFETRDTPSGPVRTLAIDDPALQVRPAVGSAATEPSAQPDAGPEDLPTPTAPEAALADGETQES